MSDRKTNFCNKFGCTTLSCHLANANIGSLKSLPILFGTCLDHMLIKFEQNRMVRNIQSFEFFDRKPGFLELFLTKLQRDFGRRISS